MLLSLSSCRCLTGIRSLIGLQHVCYVANAAIVEINIPKIRLARVDQNFADLQDSLLALALSQSFHRRRHEIKLLLQIVEANSGIYAVPVENFVFKLDRFDQAAVDILLVENIEQRLE